MVVVAQVWLDNTLTEASKIVISKNVAVPRALCAYTDDAWGIQKQNATKTSHIDLLLAYQK